jgi:uncharacterized membrane protein
MDVPPVRAASAASTGAPPVVREVDAGRGASWWSEAWRLFTPAAGTWILIIVLFAAATLLVSLIPVLGWLAVQILTPVVSGGLMLGCRAIDRGEPLTVGHLIAGFTTHASPLMIVGLIYTLLAIACAVVIFGLVFMLFGASVLAQLFSVQDPIQIGTALGGLVLAFLIAALAFLLLFAPLMMAVWFAPALVVLRGVEPTSAMKLSFRASLKNVLPMLVYGLVGILLAIVASIPLGLGWLVLAPLIIATVYTGYCDIFEDPGVAPPPAPGASTAPHIPPAA